jgi:flagellar protein FliS
VTDKTSAYLKTQILTARPEQLTLMLFDAALRFAGKARQSLQEKNYEGSFEALARAEQIVIELLNGLRPEADPELCRRQASLYLFVYSRLVEANMTRKIEPLDDAARVLGTLRETWLLLMEKLQAEGAAGDDSASARPAVTPAVSVQG